jgi:hypothetical protein
MTTTQHSQNRLLSNGKFEGVITVVCWHHKKIPHFAHALGAQHGEYPDPWDDNVYDLILRFDFTKGAPKLSKLVEPFSSAFGCVAADSRGAPS